MDNSLIEIIECFENSQLVTKRYKEIAQENFKEEDAYISSIRSNIGHLHDYFQIFYVVNAKNVFFRKNFTRYNLINDCVYIIKPNELHNYIYEDDAEFNFYEIKFNLKNPQLSSMVNSLPDIISDTSLCELKEIFKEITYEYKNSEFKDNLKYVKMYELLLKINRMKLKNTNTKRPNINPYLESTEIYLPLFDFINENYMKELTLKDMSDVLCMQRNYFARRFKTTFAISPMRYLKYIRLEKSANLLRYTNLSIQKISEQVGYDNQNSYAKAFREMYMVSPSVFRKSEKNAHMSKYK